MVVVAEAVVRVRLGGGGQLAASPEEQRMRQPREQVRANTRLVYDAADTLPETVVSDAVGRLDERFQAQVRRKNPFHLRDVTFRLCACRSSAPEVCSVG